MDCRPDSARMDRAFPAATGDASVLLDEAFRGLERSLSLLGGLDVSTHRARSWRKSVA